ncbi:hypothetical protein PybrP1_004800 [[Pythium] brassicae (nom. inval.)]|nr:hypothetical protein PybrP1_004800 [[Pythium] brassicae (nom. inval.)]
MAPKKNKQRERQEMTKAASSARAQEQLHASFASFAGGGGGGGGGGSGSGFIGFGAFAAAATASASGGTEHQSAIAQTIYDGADQDVAMALKMLGKKGSVTKIKALNSLLGDILPPRKPLEVRGMLGPFVQLYANEVRDQNDRKVRHLVSEVLAALCAKLKPKAFAPHLKRLLPSWLLAMHDVNHDAAAQATRAFETLFPAPEARAEALGEHLEAVMDEFLVFFGKTAESFEGVPLEADEREERYERCVSAAALSLGTIVTLFADLDQLAKLSDESAGVTLAGVVSSDKFARLATASSKHPSFSRDVVRKAVYTALLAVVAKAPAVVQAREEAFGKTILGALGDKTPGNHEVMWNTVLGFLQAFPSVWHASSSFPKFASSVMTPRVFSLIRHGFYGSARISFPTLLPFLSLVPLDAVGDAAKGGECALYTGVLEQCVKFLESDSARFNERYAINAFFECATAYFSIFLDADPSAAWLETVAPVPAHGEGDHRYVAQFEKALKAALVLVFTSPSTLSDANVALFVSGLLTMTARLTSFTAKKAASETASALKAAFLLKLHEWVREVILSSVTKLSVEASRVNLLVRRGVTEAETKFLDSEAAAWKQTSLAIYHAALTQLQALGDAGAVPISSAAAAGKLLVLLGGVFDTIGLQDALAGLGRSEPVAAHFDAHIRPVVQAASTWDRKSAADAATVTLTTRAIFQVCRHFFIAVSDKKSFLLQVFQVSGVQYGNMVEATDIITSMLAFPVTEAGSERWLASGSWKESGGGGDEAPESPELQALEAIWAGKLLDEFLMISLKGRLDDLDADAFAALLTASLGGVTSFPVVSPDAVVILSHFALQPASPETNDVLMRILPELVYLFAKVGAGAATLPRELAAVELKLYVRLFYVAARGVHRMEAAALWDDVALTSMKRWDEVRKLELVDTLAREINALLLARTAAGAPFNSNQFSAFAKKFLLLGEAQDALVPTQQLAQKLDCLHLRCAQDADTLAVFLDRVLPALGELCDNERIAALLGAYYADLYAAEPDATVALVSKLVDIDVAHSLTWFVFHSDASATAHGGLLDSRVEILHNYLTLDHLYEELRRASPVVLPRVLRQLVSDPSANSGVQRDHAVHRNVIFTNKNSDSATPAAAVLEAGEELSPAQSADLGSLVVAALASYVSPLDKSAILQSLLDESFEWASRAGLAVVQPLVVSLIKDDWREDSEDGEDDAAACVMATLRAFVEKLASSAQANAQYYFQFVRLAGACWRHVGEANEALKALFQEAAYASILARMESVLRPGAYASVEIAEWVLLTEFLSALPAWRVHQSDEDQAKWEAVARMAITHVIAGKQEVAKVTSLRLHKRSSAGRSAGEEEQAVLAYPPDVIRARLAMLALVRAIGGVGAGGALQELSASARETLLSIVLCALSEGIELKAHLVAAYVGTARASQSYDLVQLSLAVEQSLVHVLHSLHVALSGVDDTARVKELALESFGGVEGLATLFDAERFPMSPKLRALLYILASHSGALALRAVDASAIDINADDEAATEAALAKSVVPKAVRKALELEFSSARDVRMTRRKQKAQEREDIIGRLLLWDLFLQLFPTATNAPTMVASALSSYAQQHGLLSNFLTFCSTLLSQEGTLSRASSKLVLQDAPLFRVADLAHGLEGAWANDKASVFHVGARVFFRTVLRLPAMVRTWWNDECSRSLRSWAGKYFEDHITPFILASELEVIQAASQRQSWDADEMSVKGSRVSREITTTYVKDECALEMVIRVPASYPLRSVEVECTKRIGISEDRWRRWVLQIIKVTASQDGSLLDAVLLWKQNVDKEFEGVEPCPICYSILNPKTMGLPTLPCKTCANKYHNSCLYKWFNQSGKNKCPICQQPFH